MKLEKLPIAQSRKTSVMKYKGYTIYNMHLFTDPFYKGMVSFYV